ncbi:MAG TPA: thiamine phosphate synthase [Chloroflexota bacterium]
MGRPLLHLITDRRLPAKQLLAVIMAAVDGGVDLVQVRDKVASPEALVALSQQVHAAAAGRALVIVNGTLEIAVAACADGVHLAEGHADLAHARRTLGAAAYIGASVHSAAAARRAEQAGVSSVTFGHVYPTQSHPGEPSRGLDTLREVVAAVRIPVVAIGGIDAVRVPEVLAAGAAGVAVISAIMDAGAPGEAARRLREVLDAAATQRARE